MKMQIGSDYHPPDRNSFTVKIPKENSKSCNPDRPILRYCGEMDGLDQLIDAVLFLVRKKSLCLTN